MTILDRIVQTKQQELAYTRSDWMAFVSTFAEKEASVIAEIKLASPSFDLSDQVDVPQLTASYLSNSLIKAVSILIDEPYFKGDIKRILPIKKSKQKKPVLFKEFVISEQQIDGAAYFGYDAVLLIKRILSPEKLLSLAKYAASKNIFSLIEVDNADDLQWVLEHCGDLALYGIGINCRNLGTMEIDRQRHFDLYDQFAQQLDATLVFALSGVDDLAQVEEYRGKYNGVLIGTYFVKQLAKR